MAAAEIIRRVVLTGLPILGLLILVGQAFDLFGGGPPPEYETNPKPSIIWQADPALFNRSVIVDQAYVEDADFLLLHQRTDLSAEALAALDGDMIDEVPGLSSEPVEAILRDLQGLYPGIEEGTVTGSLFTGVDGNTAQMSVTISFPVDERQTQFVFRFVFSATEDDSRWQLEQISSSGL